MKIKIRQFYEHPNGKIDFFLNMLLDVANMLFLFLHLHVAFISRISEGYLLSLEVRLETENLEFP